MKKILFVITSNSQLGTTGHNTGFWIEEFAAPYYKLKDAGFELTLASPKGGQPPIDPNSETEDAQTEATQRFDKDQEAKKLLSQTHQLNQINPNDFDAVFYPGGHGVLWDLVEDKDSIKLIEAFNADKKPIAFVCHAPAVLKHPKTPDGKALVEGKKVTGFTNQEEAAVQLTEVVPFLLENMLVKNGGTYTKIKDWQPFAVEDGNLITGQNPASSEKVADLLAQQLKS